MLFRSDFGVSRGIGQTAAGGSLIAQSPQSLDGHPAAAADDIFALGSLIFELLSGRPPWASSDIAAHIKQQAAPPLQAADGSKLPEPVVELVLQMLDKEAGNRPAAADVVARLKAADFMPRAASIRGVVQPQLDDEVIQTVESIRSVSRAETKVAEIVQRDASGISPATVVAAFGALLAVLVVVIFVLPGNVDEKPELARSELTQGDDSLLPPVVVTDDVADRAKVFVDPELRRRIKGDATVPTRKLAGDDDITFSENRADYSGLDDEGRARFNVELTLGELLSAFQVLEARGVERWAAREHRAARDLYADGDSAYLKKDFEYAEELYLGSLTILEPLYEQIEPTFATAFADATAAFAAGDRLEALRLFELAVAVTPSHPGAQAGYQRARNLEAVLRLVDQGLEYEEDLELEAAQRS